MGGYIGATAVGLVTTAADVNGDANIEGNLTVKGTTITVDSANAQTVDLGDNDKIRLGDGDDLQIYHDGSNSLITDTGTGNLTLTGSSEVTIENVARSQYMLRATDGGDVKLFHNGSEKIATTSTGIDVTGTVTADGLTVDSSSSVVATIGSSGSSAARLYFDNAGMTTAGDTQLLSQNNDLAFNTNGSERMRINSSGRVGIGDSSPFSKLHVEDTSWSSGSPYGTVLYVNGGGVNDNNWGHVFITQTSTSTGSGGKLSFGSNSDNPFAGIKGYYAGATYGHLDFYTRPSGGTSTQRMRIDSSGKVIINATSTNYSEYLKIDGGTGGYAMHTIKNDTGSQGHLVFSNPNGAVGSIFTNGSSTSYNTSSDYRLKENVTDVTDGITRVKELAPKRFNFIANPDTTVDGFLAHEAQAVVPEAVTGTHNGMQDEEYQVSAATGDVYTPAVDAVVDEEGNEVSAAVDEVIHSSNVEQPETLEEGQQWRETTAAVMGIRSVPDYQGIDQSKLVPLLTAALQEAIAKIETLETKVAALEGA